VRSAGEIRTELLKLRDLRRLPYAHIEENSRCSRAQLVSALKLEATEEVLRKLDAYLDAKHLHQAQKDSQDLFNYERYSNELFRCYGAKTVHPNTFANFSPDRRRRMLDAMDYRCKRLFVEVIQRTGNRVILPDGANYWRCKDYVRKRGIQVDLTHGNARRVLREGPMGKSRFL
jgi:hypothetical protein